MIERLYILEDLIISFEFQFQVFHFQFYGAGQEAVLEHAHTIVNQLTVLVAYPYMMVLR